jgi:asparagine synthase (glutamine-hydrolysing)
VTLFSPLVQKELVRPEVWSRTNGNNAASETLHGCFARCPGGDSLQRIIYADLKTSLPDDLLALTDRMSMAASIECRAPLVDYQLVQFASSMPSSLKVRGLKLKYILKKALAGWLPDEILNRKKRGFGAPVGAWLRKELQPLVSELLSEDQVRKRGLFHWPMIQQILKSHQEQRQDHTDQLFGLIVLETWCRIYLDDEQGLFSREFATARVPVR